VDKADSLFIEFDEQATAAASLAQVSRSLYVLLSQGEVEQASNIQ
jgi:hypothetical protein